MSFYDNYTMFPEMRVTSDLSATNPSSSSMIGGPVMGTNLGVATAVIGALQSGMGAFFSTQSVKNNLENQAALNAINARMAESTAQSILKAGERAQGDVSLRAGKVKSSQKARQGARGVAIGVGSAAEEIATTDLMKETDRWTINANALMQAGAARLQGVNFSNQSLMQGTSARSLNPYMAASSTLLDSASTVASSWYKFKKLSALSDALGLGGF